MHGVLEDERTNNTWFKLSLKVRDNQWLSLGKRPCQPKLLALSSGDVDNQDPHILLKYTPAANSQANRLEKNTHHKLPMCYPMLSPQLTHDAKLYL